MDGLGIHIVVELDSFQQVDNKLAPPQNNAYFGIYY